GATRGYLLHENHQKTAVPGEMPPALCPVRRWGYLQASAQGCMPHPDAVAPAARNAQASPPVLPLSSAAEAFAFSLIRLQSDCFYSPVYFSSVRSISAQIERIGPTAQSIALLGVIKNAARNRRHSNCYALIKRNHRA